MKELKVGERVVLEVVESNNHFWDCENCFFAGDDIRCTGICCSFDRSDHKNIVFKEVKE